MLASMPGDVPGMPAPGMSAVDAQTHRLPPETNETRDAALPECGQGFRESVDAFQRRLVLQAIQDHNGNWTAAAKSLQVDRANLHRLARRLGLKQTD